MEFRFRSVDLDRPPFVTDTSPSHRPNLNFSFVSGCNIEPTEDHAREALQRKIEKEQIRQQIIVVETSRRREVLAEVIHEMAIEREMAIRRVSETRKMSAGEKLTSPMSEATTTSTLESKKEKLIVLNRNDLQAKDTQTGLGRPKRKVDGIETVLNERSQRKSLKSIAGAAEMKWAPARHTTVETGETGETTSLMLPDLGELGSGKQVENKMKSKYKFWCEDCGVGTYSATVMRDHKLGKKHKTVTSSTINVPQSKAIKVLEYGNDQNKKVDEMAEKESEKKTTGGEGKNVRIWCETCHIHTNSEQVMAAHRLGKKHKALHKKQHERPLAVPISSQSL